MTNATAAALWELLPAVHRIRDAHLAEEAGLDRGPLEELIAVLAREIAVMDESLAQVHDDLFIETCADWVVPYIGDLIGYQTLHPVPGMDSERAEVAHSIALRRRKGTALVLEQLARDVTGWDAKAVEYFQRLLWTQNMNHDRPGALAAPDLRQGLALEWMGTAFETACRGVDVRQIEDGSGRHNIPNVGIHCWRVRARPNRQTPAVRVGDRRYRVHPLGIDTALYNRPVAEPDITHPAEPANVPLPLTRRRLIAEKALHYGERPSAGAEIDNPLPAIVIRIDGNVVERDALRICHLGDDGGTWAHTPAPAGITILDPVLGRIALPPEAGDPADVRVDWHEGAAMDIGGGEYPRGDSLPPVEAVRVPDDFATITAALADIGGNGVIEITDSSRYTEALTIAVDPDGSIEIRAANQRRPILDLSGFSVTGGANAAFRLNGVVVTGAALEVPDDGANALETLTLLHTTFVPGLGLTDAGLPASPGAPSLRVDIPDTALTLETSITGPILAHPRATLSLTDSVIDATAPHDVAVAAPDGAGPGPLLSAENSTMLGKVFATEMPRVSGSILFAALSDGDSWTAPVRAQNTQAGCVRFSWAPPEAVLPRRYKVLPAPDGPWVAPQFASARYGTADYATLATTTPRAVRTAAETGGEIGASAHLFRTERATNIRIRMEEYLRVGLASGTFFET